MTYPWIARAFFIAVVFHAHLLASALEPVTWSVFDVPFKKQKLEQLRKAFTIVLAEIDNELFVRHNTLLYCALMGRACHFTQLVWAGANTKTNQI